MKRKYGHQIKPVIEQGSDTNRPSLSLNDKTRGKIEDFPVHCSLAWSNTSKNFGAPRKQGTF